MSTPSEIIASQPRFAKLSPDLNAEEEREARIFLRQLCIEIIRFKKGDSEQAISFLLIVSSEKPDDALMLSNQYPECRIIGVEVLRHCVKENINLPQRKTAVLTCQLKTAFICFTGLSSEAKLRLSRLAEFMGGNVCSGLSFDVTHLIADNLESEKCKYVLKNASTSKSSVKIVNRKWLEDCWELRHGMQVPSALAYLLPVDILRGTRMSCTGFDLEERALVSKLAKRFGANFKTDLDGKCTHLIAKTEYGKKYEFALQRGIPVVSFRWLVQSCIRYTCLPCDFEFDDSSSDSQSVYLNSAHSTPVCRETPESGDVRTSQNEKHQALISEKNEIPVSEECSFFEGLKFYFPSDLSQNECRDLGILCR